MPHFNPPTLHRPRFRCLTYNLGFAEVTRDPPWLNPRSYCTRTQQVYTAQPGLFEAVDTSHCVRRTPTSEAVTTVVDGGGARKMGYCYSARLQEIVEGKDTPVVEEAAVWVDMRRPWRVRGVTGSRRMGSAIRTSRSEEGRV